MIVAAVSGALMKVTRHEYWDATTVLSFHRDEPLTR